jgi:hypothetical protein
MKVICGTRPYRSIGGIENAAFLRYKYYLLFQKCKKSRLFIEWHVQSPRISAKVERIPQRIPDGVGKKKQRPIQRLQEELLST